MKVFLPHIEKTLKRICQGEDKGQIKGKDVQEILWPTENRQPFAFLSGRKVTKNNKLHRDALPWKF